MHTQFDAPWAVPLGNAEQLDAVAELLRVLDVRGGQFRDAFGVSGVEIDRHAERDGSKQCQLVRRVDAFDVKASGPPRIAELLRLREHGLERQAARAHFREMKLLVPLMMPAIPFDAVGRQSFAQRLDDRDAARYCRFECHHHALGARRLEDLVAVPGQQCLVGGDYVLARLIASSTSSRAGS